MIQSESTPLQVEPDTLDLYNVMQPPSILTNSWSQLGQCVGIESDNVPSGRRSVILFTTSGIISPTF